jgi:hypothetical protein
MKKQLFIALLFLTACSKQSVVQPSLKAGNLAISNNSLSLLNTGDVVGKVTVGYQGWFSCSGDGSPFSTFWWHWSKDNGLPGNNNTANKSWPDVREYTNTYQTAYASLGNGSPAKLFSSWDQQTVDTHFRWMQENNIDVAALQRFNPNGGEGPIRDGITAKVKTAAEAHGRKFYIMYDISGWDNFQAEIKTDWTSKMSTYITSSAYARQGGKPVVCIWGLGFPDRTMTATAEVDVINWFKSHGCYVIGGVPHEWRDYTLAGPKNFDAVFKALNMISPWMIGAIGTIQESDSYYANVNTPDMAYCKANGIAYQPCVEPGDLSARQRVHGDFMWRQFYNMIRVGAQGIYVSMFDEYGEGNQIAKAGEDASMVPAGSGILGLNEDGIHCSSDYYLRLTKDGGNMLKGLIPLTSLRPTEPVIGGGGAHLPPIGQSLHVKGYNQLYVSGENGNGPMYCNTVRADIWETFTVVDAGNGKVALQSMGKYVSSENGAAALTCNRMSVGPWEQFDYITNSDGSVSLRGNNGKFVTQEDGTKPMICDRSTASIWEKFTIE